MRFTLSVHSNLKRFLSQYYFSIKKCSEETQKLTEAEKTIEKLNVFREELDEEKARSAYAKDENTRKFNELGVERARLIKQNEMYSQELIESQRQLSQAVKAKEILLEGNLFICLIQSVIYLQNDTNWLVKGL